MSNQSELSPKQKKIVLIIVAVMCAPALFVIFFGEDNLGDANNSKEDREVFPLQIWEQGKCIICKDPWTSYQSISEVTNLKSAKNKWGEEGITADGWVLFNDVELSIPPAGKDFADFYIDFNYFAKNCWSNPYRESRVSIGSISADAINNDFLYDAVNKQKFDVLYKNPTISNKSYPSHACESWGLSFGLGEMIVLSKDFYNYNGINSSLNNSGINFELDEKFLQSAP